MRTAPVFNGRRLARGRLQPIGELDWVVSALERCGCSYSFARMLVVYGLVCVCEIGYAGT